MVTLAKQMLALVNRDRENPANAAETRGRARPLRWNEELAAVALAHSRDMLRRRYFAHMDREGRTPADRINAAGIHWRALAENIAMNRTVTDAEKDLMDEPRFQQNHRGNILDPAYTDVGIGIVQAPNGDLYITQDFIAVPPPGSDVRRGR
ncbi:MAG TPA: CAP domain-containing protein [Terriglobia bacterium]|nr:CAP domain-containing protein [Terriglobia bacterium]